MASAMPGVRTTRIDAGAVGPRRRRRSAGASGRGARRPRGCTARAPAGRARRRGGGRRRRPRCRPCRRTPRRWRAASPARRPARTTRRRARGRPARPTSSAACGTQSPGGTLERPRQRRRRAPALARVPASRRASVSVSPTSHSPSAPRIGDERIGGAVSSANPPAPAATAGPTPGPSPPSSAARRGAAPVLSVGSGPIGPESNGQDGVDDRLPAGAAAQVGGEGPVRRPPATSRGRRRRAPRRASTMPGVQNPHWDAPAAANARRPRVGVGRGRRAS